MPEKNTITTTTPRRTPILVIAALFALIGLGACASEAADSAEPSGDFNDTDVVFSAAMLPHHQLGVQMAELAIDKATHPAMRELA